MSYLQNIQIDRDLVLEFFFVISRAEFSLKAANYVTDDSGQVKPDWRRYVSELEEQSILTTITHLRRLSMHIAAIRPRDRLFETAC